MEFLRQTNARIVAFEPNPTNLYYLTRTLQHAATRDPDVAETATLTWPSRLPDCVRKRTFQKPNKSLPSVATAATVSSVSPSMTGLTRTRPLTRL